jgi:hypothetical protein
MGGERREGGRGKEVIFAYDMAYYLSRERDEDVAGAYKRYQAYLQQHKESFPSGAFALGTALWYQNASDHRCPHDSDLESCIISEMVDHSNSQRRITTIRVRLSGRYGDGYIELFYPRVFGYELHSYSCTRGLGDWRYDEFTLSSSGRLVHEIEWAGFPDVEGSRWVIKASDVEFLWIPK